MDRDDTSFRGKIEELKKASQDHQPTSILLAKSREIYQSSNAEQRKYLQDLALSFFKDSFLIGAALFGVFSSISEEEANEGWVEGQSNPYQDVGYFQD